MENITLEELVIDPKVSEEIVRCGFKKEVNPEKIIYKNEHTDLRWSYDKKEQVYVLSISTDNVLDKIMIHIKDEADIRVSYNPETKRNILSVSSRYPELMKNLRKLAKQYS